MLGIYEHHVYKDVQAPVNGTKMTYANMDSEEKLEKKHRHLS